MIVDYKMTSPTRYPPHPFAEHNFIQRPDEEPVSRTYQYRKVMKPMLERKRRARINRCLDELKELMVAALQAEGENVAKLEKADILELTVSHLHRLKSQGRLVASPEGSYAEKFKAGFTHCASEVSQFIASATTGSPNPKPAESQAGAKLLQHLSSCIRRLESAPYPRASPVFRPNQQIRPKDHVVPNRRGYAPPSPPASPTCSTDTQEVPAPSMWRPW